MIQFGRRRLLEKFYLMENMLRLNLFFGPDFAKCCAVTEIHMKTYNILSCSI
jgi:hypothetical protein